MLEVTLTVTCLTLPIKGLLLIRVNVYGTGGWVRKEWSIKKRTEGKRVKRRSGTVWHYKTLLLHKSGSQHSSIRTYTSKTTPLSPEKTSGEAQTEREHVKKSYKWAIFTGLYPTSSSPACMHACVLTFPCCAIFPLYKASMKYLYLQSSSINQVERGRAEA